MGTRRIQSLSNQQDRLVITVIGKKVRSTKSNGLMQTARLFLSEKQQPGSRQTLHGYSVPASVVHLRKTIRILRKFKQRWLIQTRSPNELFSTINSTIKQRPLITTLATVPLGHSCEPRKQPTSRVQVTPAATFIC